MGKRSYSKGATRMQGGTGIVNPRAAYAAKLKAVVARAHRQGVTAVSDSGKQAVAKRMAFYRRRLFLIEDSARRLGLAK